MRLCDSCDALGTPGTTCRECGRGVHTIAQRKTVWVVDESSRSYDWFVVAETEAGALRAFKAMWRDWCKATGADPYYWGSATDIWDGIQAREVKLGVPYMDREPFKCG